MSEPSKSTISVGSATLSMKPSFQGKDWLASTSFGGAFQRALYLLQHEFRWLILVFFIVGVILSLVLIPVNTMIATLDFLIINEIFSPVPDYLLFLNLFIASFSLGLVQRFVMFFGTFIIGTFAIYHVLRAVPSLQVLTADVNSVRFPILPTIAVAFITAMVLTVASIIVFIVPLIQVLFFFLPMFLVRGRCSLAQSFNLSIGFRTKHWMRILGVLILGYILNLFAGSLGVMFYLNIEAVLSLYGISLGLAAPILLSLLTQIPVAMVAPLIPLFSVALFAGARGAYRQKQHEKYMQRQQRAQPKSPRYIPLVDPSTEGKTLCDHCGQFVDQEMAFCTQCGKPLKKDLPSTQTRGE
jgi:hypothetical protein